MKLLHSEVRNVGVIREGTIDFRPDGVTVIVCSDEKAMSFYYEGLKAGLYWPTRQNRREYRDIKPQQGNDPLEICLTLESDRGRRVDVHKIFAGEKDASQTMLTGFPGNSSSNAEFRLQTIVGKTPDSQIQGECYSAREPFLFVKYVVTPEIYTEVILGKGQEVASEELDTLVSERIDTFVHPYLQEVYGENAHVRVQNVMRRQNPAKNMWYRLIREPNERGTIYQNLEGCDKEIFSFASLLGFYEMFCSTYKRDSVPLILKNDFAMADVDLFRCVMRMLRRSSSLGIQPIFFTTNLHALEVADAIERVKFNEVVSLFE